MSESAEREVWIYVSSDGKSPFEYIEKAHVFWTEIKSNADKEL